MDIFYIYTKLHYHILIDLNSKLNERFFFKIHLPYADLTGEGCPFVDDEDLLLVLILFRPGGI